MKIKSTILLLVTILFAGVVTLTSCKKENGPEIDDKEKPGEEDDDDNPPANSSEYLKGSDYYLFLLDGETEKSISSKVTKDYRVDEANRWLFVWDATYIDKPTSGPNAFGQVDSWISMSVTNVGWSGLGMSPDGKSTVDLSGVTDDHVLHFAIKSKDKNATYVIGLGDGSTEAKFAFGETPFQDEKALLQPYGDFPRDGEWHHIEIPFSEFTKKGLKYRSAGITSGNVFLLLSGGVQGTTLDVDGIFLYKKK